MGLEGKGFSFQPSGRQKETTSLSPLEWQQPASQLGDLWRYKVTSLLLCMLGRHFRGDLRLPEGEGSQGVEPYTRTCISLWGFLGGYLIKHRLNAITSTFFLFLLLTHLATLQAL